MVLYILNALPACSASSGTLGTHVANELVEPSSGCGALSVAALGGPVRLTGFSSLAWLRVLLSTRSFVLSTWGQGTAKYHILLLLLRRRRRRRLLLLLRIFCFGIIYDHFTAQSIEDRPALECIAWDPDSQFEKGYKQIEMA